MRSLHIAIALPLASALILLADRPSRETNPLQAHMSAEVVRLQAHFASVDGELRARDVSHLSREQRASRTRLTAWLRDYSHGATFPLNDGVSWGPIPIFRDSRGVLCAMAYLIHRSGRADLVDDIAASRNTAYVAELADDSRLIAWLDSTGLTLNEAARIQPAYDRPPPGNQTGMSASYAVTSLILSGAAIMTVGVNVVSPSQMSGVLGVVGGTAALLNGVSRLGDSDATRRVAAMNAAIGVLSVSLAFRGFSAAQPSRRSIARSEARFANVRLAPTMMPSLGEPRLGVAVRARF